MTSVKERITQDIKQSMKARDKDRVATLRLVKAEIIKKETAGGASELDEAGLIQVLQTMKKQRLDSVAQFEKGGRQELADKEKTEIGVLETLLPAQLDEQQLTQLVADKAQELGIEDMKGMGALIKAVKAASAGGADGKRISTAVKAKLGN